MARYTREKGGKKNQLSGKPFSQVELEEVCDLYIEMEGKGIHENNPKIHALARKLGREVRSVENQLLGFRKVATKDKGRQNYNHWIPIIWEEKKDLVESGKIERKNELAKSKTDVDSEFKFRVSSQLKNIIGRDLITDEYIAIYELVKNSYDAYAKHVKIIFEDDKIIIWDDGKGMDKLDILNKWLFVAYSAKKDGTEDKWLKEKESKSYRDKIRPRSFYAGSKGIGRFATDRLGSRLKLITRKPVVGDNFQQLFFNWELFETEDTEQFEDIIIPHEELISSPYDGFKHGVILEISELHVVWTRKKIAELKRSLEKLINPFEDIDKKDNKYKFRIDIICEKEIKEDLVVDKKDRINGPVENFVFETLNIKTTQIVSWIGDSGGTITTTLIDRGNLIYKIKEPNPFNYVSNSKIQLYYLNTSAKNNFTRLMGMPSVQFGNVFLFNNGFRVYPYGESGHDPFGIDRRKQQGYSRHLGSRELIGRVELWGNDEQFKETTSRDGGLVITPGTIQLEDFFKRTLGKLESFVAPILWRIRSRTGNGEETLDLTATSDIVNLVAGLSDSKKIELLDFNQDLLEVFKSQLEDATPEVFKQLEKLASIMGDEKFEKEVDTTKQQFVKLLKQKEEEERKRIQAEERAAESERLREEEAKKRQLAEERAKMEEAKRIEEEYLRLKAEDEKRKAEAEKNQALDDYERERKKNLFFNATGKENNKATLGLIHQIKITSKALNSRIKILSRDAVADKTDKQKTLEILHELKLYSEKIQKLSEIVSYSDLNFKYEKHTGDIVKFFSEYIDEIKPGLEDIRVILKTNKLEFVTNFSVLEFSIIIDNMISNSEKVMKENKKIQIDIEKSGKGIKILFSDNGHGIEDSEKKYIFDLGYTTTRGSGIGLFMVKDLIQRMGGSIRFLGNDKILKGATFEIKL